MFLCSFHFQGYYFVIPHTHTLTPPHPSFYLIIIIIYLIIIIITVSFSFSYFVVQDVNLFLLERRQRSEIKVEISNFIKNPKKQKKLQEPLHFFLLQASNSFLLNFHDLVLPKKCSLSFLSKFSDR